MDKQTDNYYHFAMTFVTRNAAATNFHLKVYTVVETNIGKTCMGPEPLFPKSSSMAIDDKAPYSFSINVPSNVKVSQVKSYVSGSFTTLDGKAKSNYNEVIIYRVADKTYGLLNEPWKTSNINEILALCHRTKKKG